MFFFLYLKKMFVYVYYLLGIDNNCVIDDNFYLAVLTNKGVLIFFIIAIIKP